MRSVLLFSSRLLLIITLMFWQGGFMFYGSVVVPVGARVLGSHRDQGFITRSVTNYLNLAGVVALSVWGLVLILERGKGQFSFWLSWALWGAMIVLLGLQFWLHPRMDELLDPVQFKILDRESFQFLHSGYLMISTLQWFLSLILAGFTLKNWEK